MTRTNLFATFSLSLVLAATGCATSGDAGSGTTDAESSATAPGSLDLWQSDDGQWRFHVNAGNGRVLLTSEGYSSRTSAIAGVMSVLDNGLAADHYAPNKTPSGKYNLHLVAGNHETIATSETYASKSNATRAIDACVRALGTYVDGLSAPKTGARVEITEVNDGTMFFDVYAQNGESVLTSDLYASVAGIWNGELAAQDAARDGRMTIQTAEDGSFFFTLTASNGQQLGSSELYTTRAAAQNGIDSVERTLAGLDLL